MQPYRHWPFTESDTEGGDGIEKKKCDANNAVA